MKHHLILILQLATLGIFVALITEPPREGVLAIALLTLLSASLVCLWTAGMIQGKEKYESNPKSLKYDFLMMLIVSSGIMAFALFRTLG